MPQGVAFNQFASHSACLMPLSFVSQFRQLLENVKTFHSILGHKSFQPPYQELSKCCGKRKKVKIVKAKEKGNILGAIKQQQDAASEATLCAYFRAVYRLS